MRLNQNNFTARKTSFNNEIRQALIPIIMHNNEKWF